MSEKSIWDYFSDDIKVAVIIYRLDRIDDIIINKHNIRDELNSFVKGEFTDDRLNKSLEKLRDYGIIDINLSEKQSDDYERIYTVNNVVLETIKGAYLKSKKVLEQESD